MSTAGGTVADAAAPQAAVAPNPKTTHPQQQQQQISFHGVSRSPSARMCPDPRMAAALGIPAMTHLVVVYRITAEPSAASSSSTPAKVKPDYVTKRSCFLNFCEALMQFLQQYPHIAVKLVVLQDACNPTLRQFVSGMAEHMSAAFRNLSPQLKKVSVKNNCVTFLLALAIVLQTAQEATLPTDSTGVYMVEDDYLHVSSGVSRVLEGLAFAPYCTGYAHPDKTAAGHPLGIEGGEEGVLYSAPSSYWHTTCSTTMTFAAALGDLQTDEVLFKTACQERDAPPRDSTLWPMLLVTCGKRLVCSIPAACTHGETTFLSPHVNWAALGTAAMQAIGPLSTP